MKIGILFVISLLLPSYVVADIYEIIDKEGKKTYTNTAPHHSSEVQPKKIVPKETNVWREDEQDIADKDVFFEELSEQQREADALKQKNDRLQQAAADRVKAAEANLEQAKLIQAGDYYPNKNGGLRLKPTYKERVEAAEKAVAEARNRQKNTRLIKQEPRNNSFFPEEDEPTEQ